MCTTCGCSGHTEQTDQTEHHTHHASHSRLIEVELDLLARNNAHADKNRSRLLAHNTLALNLVSSPGAGKTTLLVESIKRLIDSEKMLAEKICVIEGDQQTDRDAKRISETGVVAKQINTGKGCHLDAHAIGHAMDDLDLNKREILFIENVGNLVCPAAFDLGERAKVVVLSVTEGDDKPLKYPDMFKASSLMLINKMDLQPYVDFDVGTAIEYARRINPDIEVICLSATTGEGMESWIEWINARRHQSSQ